MTIKSLLRPLALLLTIIPTAIAAETTTVEDKMMNDNTSKLIDKVVPANNNFGFRLFDQLLQQDKGKNVFISPPSVAIALAMTYNGAAGNTQKAMAKTLGLEGMSLAEMNQANAALRNMLLHQLDPKVSLLIANSLWMKTGFKFTPDFQKQNQQFYDAKVTEADFHNSHTVSEINRWVNENTQGKIDQLVQRIDPLTVLFIINAIYFKGTWAEQFDKAKTENRGFTLLNGDKKQTPMMSQKSYYRYYKGQNYQAVSLPYGQLKNSRINMVIFLPDSGISLENFPLPDKWREWRVGYTSQEGTIFLPRFKVEYEATLNEVLKALGMAEAFNEKQADFSKMATVPKSQNIYISLVKHKTVVEVNEEGTEAAAATKVEMVTRGMKPRPFQLEVNHPFFFTIQDDETDTVLFMGAIVEPK